MSELQEQLDLLRRRLTPRRVNQEHVDEYLAGAEVETPLGRHWEIEKLFERHRRHGGMEISDLEDLPGDLLDPISDGRIVDVPPSSWAFLDTETSGLAGGSGTYAFLVGVGRITPEGFRVRQFFMREYGEEPSLLHALTEHLREFQVLITYNGKTFDQPLLETRYRMSRLKLPFDALEHLDLLFGARRLWKLRFESCRLVDLEREILGVERQGDVPGAMIPSLYFEYLRTRSAGPLIPVFHHNAIDILTLAALTGIVPRAFQAPGQARFTHAGEMIGLGRWHRQAGAYEHALALFRQAIERKISDELLFRTMWDIACLEKKLDRHAAALAVLGDLATCKNPFRVLALEALAKHYEHRERNFAAALEYTRRAIELSATKSLEHRAERLERLVGRRQ